MFSTWQSTVCPYLSKGYIPRTLTYWELKPGVISDQRYPGSLRDIVCQETTPGIFRDGDSYSPLKKKSLSFYEKEMVLVPGPASNNISNYFTPKETFPNLFDSSQTDMEIIFKAWGSHEYDNSYLYIRVGNFLAPISMTHFLDAVQIYGIRKGSFLQGEYHITFQQAGPSLVSLDDDYLASTYANSELRRMPYLPAKRALPGHLYLGHNFNFAIYLGKIHYLPLISGDLWLENYLFSSRETIVHLFLKLPLDRGAPEWCLKQYKLFNKRCLSKDPAPPIELGDLEYNPMRYHPSHHRNFKAYPLFKDSFLKADLGEVKESPSIQELRENELALLNSPTFSRFSLHSFLLTAFPLNEKIVLPRKLQGHVEGYFC